MTEHQKLNYVEFPAKDLPSTKAFFSKAFGWTFEDFGPEYTAFANQGLDGGFYQSQLCSEHSKGAALLVLLSEDLESTLNTVVLCGGIISEPIFSFPGGRRFHFIEPSGNELAVWEKTSA
jgi:predicted enzyme related to lactoylglutathione lyase